MYRNHSRFLSLFAPDNGPATPVTDGPGAGGGAGSVPPAGMPDSGQQAADRGFPENTPIASMTDAERANYYKFQNRQTDNKLSAFNGVTPEQVSQMAADLEAMRTEKLSADEKAIKAATDKAAAEARAAAEAELRPKLDQAEVRSIAAQFLTGDQLSAFIATVNPASFYGDNGGIDTEKVVGHLTALFGGGKAGAAPAQQVHRSWGQYSAGTGAPITPGSAGIAEAQKRFGTKT